MLVNAYIGSPIVGAHKQEPWVVWMWDLRFTVFGLNPKPLTLNRLRNKFQGGRVYRV